MGNIALFFVFMVVTVLIPGPAAMFTVTCAVQLGRSHFFSSPDSREYRLVFLGPCHILRPCACHCRLPDTLCSCAGARCRHPRFPRIPQLGKSRRLFRLTNPVLLAGLVATFPQCIDPSAPYLTQATVLVTLCTMVYFAGQVFYGFLALAARGYLLGHGLWGLLKKASAVLFWLFALGIFVRLFS